MKFSEYKDLIKERLEAYFSFLPDNTHLAQNYDLAAEFSSRQIQTALFKENVMDYLDSKEFCLLSNLQDEQTIDSELAKLPDIAISSANPSRHHKSTVVTRVFVTEKDVSLATLSKIKKFKFSKAFRFLFWGWTEVHLLLVNLQDNKVYSNWAGRIHKKVFTANT